MNKSTDEKKRLPARVALCGLLLLAQIWVGRAQGALKTVDTPQGGRIVYGEVADQTTEAGAMGSMLRSLHDEYGVRPQVGRLFQVRGSESVAVFFSVTKRNGGNGQLVGLIIVTKVSTDQVEAAMICDDASHFPSSRNSLMKTLFGVWHPFEAAHTASASSNGSAAPLKEALLPDRSASVSLPDGWQIVPKVSGGGTIYLAGPNAETAALGMAIQVWDPRNPRVAQIMRNVRQGGQENNRNASALFYPQGGDPGATYTNLIQMERRRAGMGPAAFQMTGSTPLPARAPRRGAHLTGQVDFQDGKGLRELSVIYYDSPPSANGGWFCNATVTTVPLAVADRERATLAAILQSYRVNQTAVNQEGAVLAKPEIDRIHAIGDAAAAQAAAAHERNDIHNSSVYQQWDDEDKRSQAFENYQLGYSVVSDTGNNAHATMWNEDAEALVSQNPQHFEYVDAPNFWKGVDY